jgi:hypothetical protein
MRPHFFQKSFSVFRATPRRWLIVRVLQNHRLPFRCSYATKKVILTFNHRNLCANALEQFQVAKEHERPDAHAVFAPMIVDEIVKYSVFFSIPLAIDDSSPLPRGSAFGITN